MVLLKAANVTSCYSNASDSPYCHQTRIIQSYLTGCTHVIMISLCMLTMAVAWTSTDGVATAHIYALSACDAISVARLWR